MDEKVISCKKCSYMVIKIKDLIGETSKETTVKDILTRNLLSDKLYAYCKKKYIKNTNGNNVIFIYRTKGKNKSVLAKWSRLAKNCISYSPEDEE